MTRINCGINPSLLTTPHLNAEAREIKRVPNTIKSGRAKLEGIPSALMNDYTPTERDRDILIERLISRDPIYKKILLK